MLLQIFIRYESFSMIDDYHQSAKNICRQKNTTQGLKKSSKLKTKAEISQHIPNLTNTSFLYIDIKTDCVFLLLTLYVANSAEA